MPAQLSPNYCKLLSEIAKDESSSFLDAEHLLQVLHIQQVQAPQDPHPRYLLVVSDSVYFLQMLLSPKLSHLIEDARIVPKSLVTIMRVTIGESGPLGRVHVLHGIRPYEKDAPLYGRPRPLPGQGASSSGSGVNSQRSSDRANERTHSAREGVSPTRTRDTVPLASPARPLASSAAMNFGAPDRVPLVRAPTGPSIPLTSPMQQSAASTTRTATHKISASSGTASAVANRPNTSLSLKLVTIDVLNPYLNKWTIRVLVQSKSGLQPMSKTSGNYFNVQLKDDTGTIKAIAFGQDADNLHHQLEPGKTYDISSAQIKPVPAQYRDRSYHDFELVFRDSTRIEEVPGLGNAVPVTEGLVEFSELERLASEPGGTCDVQCIVTGVGEVVTRDIDGEEVPLRELTLLDRSGGHTTMSLWRNEATDWAHQAPIVILCKDAKIRPFRGGYHLTKQRSTSITVGPDNEEARELWDWYQTSGTMHQHAAPSTAASGQTNTAQAAPIHTIAQVVDRMDAGEENFTFTVMATTVTVDPGKRKVWYPICPNRKCGRKKITQVDGGNWLCGQCSQNYVNPRYTYLFHFVVADTSGPSITLQGSNRIGETLFGMSADTLHDVKEQDESRYNSILHNALPKTYKFTCRSKRNIYNDTVRYEYDVKTAEAVDYHAEATRLRNSLMV